jgi:hypothetical protein
VANQPKSARALSSRGVLNVTPEGFKALQEGFRADDGRFRARDGCARARDGWVQARDGRFRGSAGRVPACDGRAQARIGRFRGSGGRPQRINLTLKDLNVTSEGLEPRWETPESVWKSSGNGSRHAQKPTASKLERWGLERKGASRPRRRDKGAPAGAERSSCGGGGRDATGRNENASEATGTASRLFAGQVAGSTSSEGSSSRRSVLICPSQEVSKTCPGPTLPLSLDDRSACRRISPSRSKPHEPRSRSGVWRQAGRGSVGGAGQSP